MESHKLIVRDGDGLRLLLFLANGQDFGIESGTECGVEKERIFAIAVQLGWDRHEPRPSAAIA